MYADVTTRRTTTAMAWPLLVHYLSLVSPLSSLPRWSLGNHPSPIPSFSYTEQGFPTLVCIWPLHRVELWNP